MDISTCLPYLTNVCVSGLCLWSLGCCCSCRLLHHTVPLLACQLWLATPCWCCALRSSCCLLICAWTAQVSCPPHQACTCSSHNGWAECCHNSCHKRNSIPELCSMYKPTVLRSQAQNTDMQSTLLHPSIASIHSVHSPGSIAEDRML